MCMRNDWCGKVRICKKFRKIVSDADVIGSKKKQLDFTMKNHDKGVEIYHITCI